jgi:hypothetical protein
MSRATPEATGRRHWVTTLSVLPWQPPGQQQTKQQQQNAPTLLAILMALAVHRYDTTRIPDGRGQGLCYTPLVAAIRQVLRPIVAIGHTNICLLCVFSS